MVIDLIGHRFFIARWFEDGREDAVRALSIFEDTVCGQRLPGPVFAKGQKTAMPGLRDPVAQRALLPQTGVHPPHAAKALFKMNSFLDRLLEIFAYKRHRLGERRISCIACACFSESRYIRINPPLLSHRFHDQRDNAFGCIMAGSQR
jgi:hypothetical protein